jgi:hypothetical protein
MSDAVDEPDETAAPSDVGSVQGGVRGVFSRKLALEEETAVFILVNFADIVLTALAFRYGGWEANLLAAWVIRRFGIMGLAYYKFTLVTLVILITQYVHHAQPRTARWVLIGGSIMYCLLAVYVTLTLFRHVFTQFS